MLSSRAIKSTGALVLVASLLLFGQGGSISQGSGLPSQTGNAGKFLTTDGTTPSWKAVTQTGTLFYFMTPNSSDISGDLAQTLATYTPTTPLTLPAAGFSGSGTFTVQDWATPSGAPGQAFFPAGSYVCHVHANRTNPFVGTLTMQCTFIEVSSTGVVIGTIGTTDPTPPLNNVNMEYEEEFLDPNPYTLASTSSRIVTRVQAVCTSCPATTQLVINVGADTDTHIVLPTVQAPGGVQSVAGLTGVVPGQGTDTNILTSGTVSGLGNPLCVDSNGGATTSGCPTATKQVYTFSATLVGAGQVMLQQVPAACTIFGWSAIADPASTSGAFTADVDAVGNSAPPAVPAIPNTTSNKISASAPITFSSAVAASGGATQVASWGTSRSQWDSFALNVTTFSTLNYVNVSVWCQ